MRKTKIVKKSSIELKNPILLEGLPGQGLVGKIATDYLIRNLGGKRFADLYSPHFAYYVLVDKKGTVRLLRFEFYYWKNLEGDNDLILLTGDSQPQTIEGQYEVANTILNFSKENKVKMILTVGGFRKEIKGTSQVMISATKQEILEKASSVGVKNCPPGRPIVGMAGVLVGLAKLSNVDAACFLVETPGYLPDAKAAKKLLVVIKDFLGINLDLKDLDKEIAKSEQLEKRMKRMEKQRNVSKRKREEIEKEKTTYIG